jgi:ABC-type multidrug transport system fused ATPase/permease subunit
MPSLQPQQSQASAPAAPATTGAAPTASSARNAARRRQRSTRLTVAVALLAVATLLVGWALVAGIGWLTSLVAVAALVLGAAATRITHTEVMQARRDAARDRAEQAAEYAALTAERTAENAAFAADMRRKIADREEAIDGLELALSKAQRHAAEQTRKLNAEARRAELAEQEGTDLTRRLDEAEERAAEAVVRVAELEQEVDVLRAEVIAWQGVASQEDLRKHA